MTRHKTVECASEGCEREALTWWTGRHPALCATHRQRRIMGREDVTVYLVEDQSQLCPSCGVQIEVGQEIVFGVPGIPHDEGTCRPCSLLAPS